jgi:sugar fermentation stimulation protein A
MNPFFQDTVTASFISRPNRFVVTADLNGKRVRAYLPNPGRLMELLFPGTRLWLEPSAAAGRRLKLTCVAAEREGIPIMLHTHRTNDAAAWLLEQGLVPGLERATVLGREKRSGRSRFDFLLQVDGKKMFLEVKSCTLFGGTVAMFPDAITDRGRRHVEHMAGLAEKGQGAAILFMVQWPRAEIFMPDFHTDLAFAQTLLRHRRRVRIIPVSVEWTQELEIAGRPRLLHVPWHVVEREAHDRGSYFLVLELKRDRSLSVGGLGRVRFRKGFYVYVGSAMKNLSKRMERHRRLLKKQFWHIDFLRPAARFHAALAVRSSSRLECDLARAVADLSEWDIPGFGSSDCRCASHLFAVGRDPLASREFQNMLLRFRMERLVGYEDAG